MTGRKATCLDCKGTGIVDGNVVCTICGGLGSVLSYPLSAVMEASPPPIEEQVRQLQRAVLMLLQGDSRASLAERRAMARVISAHLGEGSR